MEQNFPIVAKKFWDIVRLMYLVLRKEISKRKLLFNLNMTLYRSKLADQLAAIQKLMFHHIHHHSAAAAANHHLSKSDVPVKKYDVSKNSQSHPILLLFQQKKRGKRHHAPPPIEDAPPPPTDDIFMEASLEIFHSAMASPELSGFEPSPIVRQVRQARITDSPLLVRQVRITDSPFPLNDVDQEKNRVDEAAEDFIMNFYDKLRRQNLLGTR